VRLTGVIRLDGDHGGAASALPQGGGDRRGQV